MFLYLAGLFAVPVFAPKLLFCTTTRPRNSMTKFIPVIRSPSFLAGACHSFASAIVSKMANVHASSVIKVSSLFGSSRHFPGCFCNLRQPRELLEPP